MITTKKQTKFFGSVLLLVAVTLIILCSGCTSNANQVPLQPVSPSTDVTPTPTSTPAVTDIQEYSPIVVFDDNESKYNGTLPENDVALSGTLTPIVNASTVTGYIVNLHLKNNGAPFSFTCTKVTFSTTQRSGDVVSTSGAVIFKWSEGHIRTGHTGAPGEQKYLVQYTTLMPNDVLDYNISTVNDISELQQNGKLDLRIDLCSGSSSAPSLCTFETVIPRAQDVINTKEYPLTFSSVNANN